MNPSFHGLYELLVGTLTSLLVVNGVDDLMPLSLCLWSHFRRKDEVSPVEPRKTERRIAIFVPCWQESAVIGDMVRHNIAVVRYRKYDIFLGVYPNDEATQEVARELSRKSKNVHVALCPNPGPTSKADCLNAVFERMAQFERQRRVKFDTVVLHDAEDLIHPEALSVINQQRERYEMVQVPVLPLPTPAFEFTHALYCEDFSEYQTIDMRARQISGSFIPSNGVGTGYSRTVLEEIGRQRGTIFEPASLTEDYESGVLIHAMAFPQIFCPVEEIDGGDIIATREYFPRRFHSAVRQRSRWILGNCLQSWERHGWRGPLNVKYWFWRDRKGLLTNPVSCVTNVVFAAGVVTWCWSVARHEPWLLQIQNRWIQAGAAATLALQFLRTAVRIVCTGRLFGYPFAIWSPVRAFHGNLINALASIAAIRQYVAAKRSGATLAWVKTDHSYADETTRAGRRRSFEEVLVDGGFLTKAKLKTVARKVPADADLANYLFCAGTLNETDLSEIAGLRYGAASTHVDPEEVNPAVSRVLPLECSEGWRAIPFRVESGKLLVAATMPPKAADLEACRTFTRLEIECHLVTWRNFEELRRLVV